MNTGGPRSGLPDSCTRPSHRSVANHLTRPSIALSRYPSACWASRFRGSGLRCSLASSPLRPAESRSSSYGPMIHLRLLSTPPHGDAATFGYRPESVCLKGTCTPPIEYTFRRTNAGILPARPAMTMQARCLRYEFLTTLPVLLEDRSLALGARKADPPFCLDFGPVVSPLPWRAGQASGMIPDPFSLVVLARSAERFEGSVQPPLPIRMYRHRRSRGLFNGNRFLARRSHAESVPVSNLEIG